MTEFKDILSQKVEDIKVLPPLPEGLYRGKLAKMDLKEIGKNKTPAAEYEVHLIEPIQVDEDELAAAGGMREAKSRYVVWLSEKALPMAKGFVEECGVKMKNRTLGECLTDCVGAEARMLVKHESDPNKPEVKYLRVENVTAL